MTFHVETTRRFDKQLKKLDNFTAKTILKWLDKNIEGVNNPRTFGKPLVGNHSGKWRYRIGDYRVITKIDDKKLIILALEVGHRKDIYKN
ncbi:MULTISPECIES: type II toxin-antitoxin system RelE family toxin [Tetragenococcus]|uniref:type II toxin-antitoxin system RelE family toxin n=1 Tax=Tetragenococcus TaxID=51668 RepID=UPI000B92B277|nr:MULTISPECIES: type II toxin-antitoxin system RelE/ParE family toxin [Tetragenococcus]MCF1613658.1 type II toxin-antitoxin system RelE/ParE family toxin [Tetragenococcus koreensis]MCF1623346.1 type II toxin-antitoxin system RelE/ParE family toxin [Tetragenococcus koreensis]